jgi:hypothetical protein
MATSAATKDMAMTVVKREATETSAVTKVVAMEVERDATSTAQSAAMRVVGTAETTVPVVDTQEEVRVDTEVTRDAMSPLDMVTDLAADQVMAEMPMKTRGVHKLSATTTAPAVAVEAMVEAMVETSDDTKAVAVEVMEEMIPTTIVLQEVKVAAIPAMEATQAPMAASSHQARPTVVATVVQTSFLALLSTHNQAVEAPAIPTSSAWPSVC